MDKDFARIIAHIYGELPPEAEQQLVNDAASGTDLEQRIATLRRLITAYRLAPQNAAPETDDTLTRVFGEIPARRGVPETALPEPVTEPVPDLTIASAAPVDTPAPSETDNSEAVNAPAENLPPMSFSFNAVTSDLGGISISPMLVRPADEDNPAPEASAVPSAPITAPSPETAETPAMEITRNTEPDSEKPSNNVTLTVSGMPLPENTATISTVARAASLSREAEMPVEAPLGENENSATTSPETIANDNNDIIEEKTPSDAPSPSEPALTPETGASDNAPRRSATRRVAGTLAALFALVFALVALFPSRPAKPELPAPRPQPVITDIISPLPSPRPAKKQSTPVPQPRPAPASVRPAVTVKPAPQKTQTLKPQKSQALEVAVLPPHESVPARPAVKSAPEQDIDIRIPLIAAPEYNEQETSLTAIPPETPRPAEKNPAPALPPLAVTKPLPRLADAVSAHENRRPAANPPATSRPAEVPELPTLPDNPLTAAVSAPRKKSAAPEITLPQEKIALPTAKPVTETPVNAQANTPAFLRRAEELYRANKIMSALFELDDEEIAGLPEKERAAALTLKARLELRLNRWIDMRETIKAIAEISPLDAQALTRLRTLAMAKNGAADTNTRPAETENSLAPPAKDLPLTKSEVSQNAPAAATPTPSNVRELPPPGTISAPVAAPETADMEPIEPTPTPVISVNEEYFYVAPAEKRSEEYPASHGNRRFTTDPYEMRR